MGKLHTLRRDIQRNRAKWIDAEGAVRDPRTKEWRPSKPQRYCWFPSYGKGSYLAFIRRVLNG